MENERIPNLNAGFWIIFPTNINVSTVKQHLPQDTVFEHYPDSIYATVVEVENCYDWEIDTVLTRLFSLCDLDHLSEISKMFGGKIHIGLWYYSYGTRPAVIFEGKNMATIHKLDADLSIDAY